MSNREIQKFIKRSFSEGKLNVVREALAAQDRRLAREAAKKHETGELRP